MFFPGTARKRGILLNLSFSLIPNSNWSATIETFCVRLGQKRSLVSTIQRPSWTPLLNRPSFFYSNMKPEYDPRTRASAAATPSSYCCTTTSASSTHPSIPIQISFAQNFGHCSQQQPMGRTSCRVSAFRFQ